MNEANSQNKHSEPVALITGSAQRIGAEIARKLHHNNYRVIIHCNHSLSAANNIVDKLNQSRANSAFVISSDLSQAEGCAELIDKATNTQGPFAGRLDALINNASAFFPTDINESDESINLQNWSTLFDTNLRAPFLLAQQCSAALKLTSGSIINITDIHGQRPLSGYSIYSMTKAGLISMTQSLAKELAPKIRVNGVSPGAILWPEAEIDDIDKQQKVLNKIPLKRMGAPENIAHTVLFLLQNDYISGQIINVDGGRSL